MANRLTDEEFKRRLLADGRGITTDTPYIKASAKHIFTCKEGHEWSATANCILSGHGCPVCAGMRRRTNEEIIEILKMKGFSVVSEIYSWSRYITLQCSKGHTWSTIARTAGTKSGCPTCHKERKEISLAQANARLKSHGLEIISEYKNTIQNATFKCSHNHTFIASPSNIFRTKNCPVCVKERIRHTPETINKYLADKNIDAMLIGKYTNTITPTEFRCSKGHTWIAKPNTVMYAKECPICYRERTWLSKEKVNERLSGTDLELIGDYKNTTTKSLFRCSCGNEWEALPSNILKGQKCSKCSKNGFNISKPTIFYLININDECLGFGITNSFESRHRTHRNNFKKHSVTYEFLATFECSGKQALEIEAFIKHNYKIIDTGIEGFRKEATELLNTNEIIQHINKTLDNI